MQAKDLKTIALPGGQVHFSSATEVNQKIAALLGPWLEKALLSGERLPLAVPAVSHFSASAKEEEGALLMTLWAPAGFFQPERPHTGDVVPLAALGVARDNASGRKLWAKLLQDSDAASRKLPRAPWCAVRPDASGLRAHPAAVEWLGDLADSVARAWLARNQRLAATAKLGPN
jgi:hypothetical protein